MRRLIINADDLGLTPGVNRAIAEAHGHGVVTSATLMANGPAFDDAVRMAQSAPGLSVGCHVVLVDGVPVLDGAAVSSLAARDTNGDSRLGDGLSRFALRVLTGRIDAEEVQAEATAQIRKIQAAGLVVSHLDTHKHTHAFPQVLRPILRAARACSVHAIRNPFERVRLGSFTRKPELWIRASQVLSLRSLASSFRRALDEAGMSAPDGTAGMIVTGALDERLFRSVIQSLPEGTWEFVCHPGYNDAQLQNTRTRLRESRVQELRVLTSDATREWLAKTGIELISYRDLA